MIKLYRATRKTDILRTSSFGCLRDVPSINITKGCLHGCVYCYARGFTDALPKGEVYLYHDLPERLEKELQRKRRLPLWVSFSTASDPFQDIDEVLNTTYSCMRLLLERGIGISFLTKGSIPSEFIDLFRRYPERIKARIGIVSLRRSYKRLFEPMTAYPESRIKNITNLLKAGIEVSVRIDPVIPSITDSYETIEELLKVLKDSGVGEVSVSALVMRPSIMDFFQEIPEVLRWRILGFYRGEPWQRVITSAKTRLLPLRMRRAIYERFKEVAQRFRMNIRICGCKNPDMPWEFCNPWVEGGELNRQMGLFG